MQMKTDASVAAALPAFRARAFSAFTLIELLVVISILAMLMAFILPMFNVKDKALLVKTRTDMVQIAAAWNKYFEEYKQWPANGEMDGALAGKLFGDNPSGIVFFDRSMSTNASGEMRNAWGNLINVKFDQKMENSISVSETGQSKPVNKSVVVYSECIINGTSVWVTSW